MKVMASIGAHHIAFLHSDDFFNKYMLLINTIETNICYEYSVLQLLLGQI